MIYEQKTGNLTLDNDTFLGRGYSGHGLGKNNPDMENVKNIGPIPKGKYMLGNIHNSKETGPLTISLIPDPKNEMFGRSAFAIHGDSILAPGTASHGCIIMSRSIRNAIIISKEKYLIVV